MSCCIVSALHEPACESTSLYSYSYFHVSLFCVMLEVPVILHLVPCIENFHRDHNKTILSAANLCGWGHRRNQFFVADEVSMMQSHFYSNGVSDLWQHISSAQHITWQHHSLLVTLGTTVAPSAWANSTAHTHKLFVASTLLCSQNDSADWNFADTESSRRNVLCWDINFYAWNLEHHSYIELERNWETSWRFILLAVLASCFCGRPLNIGHTSLLFLLVLQSSLASSWIDYNVACWDWAY